MSIPVDKSIKELEYQIKLLGLSLPEKEKIKKDDLVEIIRDYYVKSLFNGKPTKDLELMLKIKSPMLAMRFSKLKSEDKNNIINSEDWILEEKIDGLRCLAVKTGNKINFYIRKNDETTLLPINITKNITRYENIDIEDFPDFIIDGELVSSNGNVSHVLEEYNIISSSQQEALFKLCTSNPDMSIKAIKQSKINLKLVCFDCLYYIDKFITEKPLRERKLVLNEIVNEIEENELDYSLNIGFEEVYSTFNKDNKPKNKKYLINYFTKPGFEGLMAKNLNGTYITDTCRNRKGWIKLKKEDVDNTEYSISLLDDICAYDYLFNDTYDVIISGYNSSTKKGIDCLDSIEVSLYDTNEKLTKIGDITVVPNSELTRMTYYSKDGIASLHPNFIDSVVEVRLLSGSIEKRNACFEFISYRPDKNKFSCISV